MTDIKKILTDVSKIRSDLKPPITRIHPSTLSTVNVDNLFPTSMTSVDKKLNFVELCQIPLPSSYIHTRANQVLANTEAESNILFAPYTNQIIISTRTGGIMVCDYSSIGCATAATNQTTMSSHVRAPTWHEFAVLPPSVVLNANTTSPITHIELIN